MTCASCKGPRTEGLFCDDCRTLWTRVQATIREPEKAKRVTRQVGAVAYFLLGYFALSLVAWHGATLALRAKHPDWPPFLAPAIAWIGVYAMFLTLFLGMAALREAFDPNGARSSLIAKTVRKTARRLKLKPT